MAKETQKEKITRLEAELEEMTKQRDSYRDEANNLKKQVNAAIEDTDLYRSTVRQLQEMENQRNTAIKQQERYREKVLRLEDERENWATSAQNTAENVPEVQAIDKPETSQNGTQGGIEAIAEHLPENMPLGKWQQEMIEKLRDIYDVQNQNLKEEAAVKIVRIWCATQKAEEALGMLYDYILVHLPQESDEQDEPDTISGFAREKIEALQEKITELEAKIEGAETTAQYNSVTEKYKVVNDLRNELNNKNTALGKSEAERNTLKNDLDNLRAEYEQATRHNARGAGRKPKLTDDQEQEIKQLRATGLSVRQIAAKMSCSTGLVCKILHNCINS